MANFKELKKGPIGITASYSGGVKVYVESTGDEYILKKKWFPDLLGKLSIEAVSADTGANGGCQIVIKKVTEARDAGVEAFGIVDRDSLLSDPAFRNSLFWETDEATFSAAKPFGPYIHVLMRWEIENYLLKPMAVAELLRDKALRAISLATDDLLENEEDLVLRTTLDVINVGRGQTCPADKFAEAETGDALKQKVLHILQVSDAELEVAKHQISAFFNGEADKDLRWDKLCRIVNGKRAMHQLGQFLCRKHGALKTLKLEESEKGALATHVANLKLVDAELKTRMTSFAAAAG